MMGYADVQLAIALSLCGIPLGCSGHSGHRAVAHVDNTFTFTLAAPLREAAPLFGPQGERAWAGPTWDPQPLFPASGADVEGAVFTLPHGPHRSGVWVNTRYDPTAGQMQYVVWLPDLFVSTIDVALQPLDAMHTKVEVRYIRTALRPEANEQILEMGRHDARQGPEWEHAISTYLARDHHRA